MILMLYLFEKTLKTKQFRNSLSYSTNKSEWESHDRVIIKILVH